MTVFLILLMVSPLIFMMGYGVWINLERLDARKKALEDLEEYLRSKKK